MVKRVTLRDSKLWVTRETQADISVCLASRWPCVRHNFYTALLHRNIKRTLESIPKYRAVPLSKNKYSYMLGRLQIKQAGNCAINYN